MVSLVMRKLPSKNSFVTSSQFGFGGGGGGQGSGQMIDKGAETANIFYYSSIQPLLFKYSFTIIKCRSMADVLKKEENVKN